MSDTTTSKRDAVREYIRQRIEDRPDSLDPFVRITGDEIGKAVGMTPQSVNEYVREFLELGLFVRVRRSYFGLGNLPRTFREPSENLPRENSSESVDLLRTFSEPSEKAATFREPSENLLRTFSEGDNINIKDKEEDKDKEKQEIKNIYVWGDICWNGIRLGDGLLREGTPANADEIDLFVDWSHPKVIKIVAGVHKMFPTGCPGWSHNLTKRIAFGAIYILTGFHADDLRKLRSLLTLNSQALDEWKRTEPGFRRGKKPCDTPWYLVGKHVRDYFEGAGIDWTPCESSAKEKTETRGEQVRDLARQRKFPFVDPEPVRLAAEVAPIEKTQETDPLRLALSTEIGAERFGVWFQDAEFHIRDDYLEIVVRDSFYAEWIKKNFKEEIAKVYGTDQIVCTVRAGEPIENNLIAQ